MTWEQLSINRPHLVYILLGAFTSVFMLVSLFIKEKLYIGEATVATIFGVIFGPHAANLINPLTWGNTDQITLEFSRIVLVVQCFAVGVELPKAYMERHWRSVVFLLVPVMTFGWLITSLFVWWLIVPLNWLQSLIVAACVTATDPVLASSVVGKGKFAKRVPKHLRDLLSAESGCNDGMAFPFIYLGLYLLRYHLNAGKVSFHWICFTILYECIFGAFYGFMVGYIARHAIRFAHNKGIVDRESFLVFYFVLALFCAGSGSLLGMDDLLIGFAAGVGFSNDGWFTEKTEESHVSNVIDLLLNLTYFVYFGTIIPWDQYNAAVIGLEPWRLVSIAILVLFFRRIPIMMALKPLIPDIKTWREALFAGHFGPIGVGAIFVAILARAELETEGTTPLAELPSTSDPEYTLIYMVWPIVTFLVIASIIVHGSSVAVFTLGKRINTLTLTYSYTTGNDKSSAWMDRLPRIASRGRSMSKMSDDDGVSQEKETFPFALRRVKAEDEEKAGSRSSSMRPTRRRKKKNHGGNVSASAIQPMWRESQQALSHQESGSDTLNEKSTSPDDEVDKVAPDQSASGDSTPLKTDKNRSRSPSAARADVEAYEEGGDLVIEDEEGNVLRTVKTNGRPDEEKQAIIEASRKELASDRSGRFAKHKHETHRKNEGDEIERKAEEAIEHPGKGFKEGLMNWKGFGKKSRAEGSDRKAAPKRGPAHAYQYGNTIIIEDEDGEVIKEYTLPADDNQQRRFTYNNDQVRSGLQRMGTWVGLSHKPERVAAEASGVPEHKLQEVERANIKGEDSNDSPTSPVVRKPEPARRKSSVAQPTNDDGLRLTISRADRYGLTGLQKRKGGEFADEQPALLGGRRMTQSDFVTQLQQLDARSKARVLDSVAGNPEVKRTMQDELAKQDDGGQEDYFSAHPKETSERRQIDRDDSYMRPRPRRQDTTESVESMEIPTHDTRSTIARHGRGKTAADLRRERLSTPLEAEDEGGVDPSPRISRFDRSSRDDDQQETAAEKRRRLAALGIVEDDEESSESESEAPRKPKDTAVREPDQSPAPARRIQWATENVREQRNTAGREEEEDQDHHHSHDHALKVGKKIKGIWKR